TDLSQPGEILHRDAERGENHDVPRRDAREVEFAAGSAEQEIDSHGPELRIHMRIVDDFADEEGAALGKLGARFVRILDRPIDTVAEPEFARQPKGEVADLQPVAA